MCLQRSLHTDGHAKSLHSFGAMSGGMIDALIVAAAGLQWRRGLMQAVRCSKKAIALPTVGATYDLLREPLE